MNFNCNPNTVNYISLFCEGSNLASNIVYTLGRSIIIYYLSWPVVTGNHSINTKCFHAISGA